MKFTFMFRLGILQAIQLLLILQGMLQNVSIAGYSATCFCYRVCCKMFLLQGMLQHVSVTGYAATCFCYRVCYNMFALLGTLQHVSIAGYAATCFGHSVRALVLTFILIP